MGAPSTLLRLASTTVVAPAKINLALHVTGRRGDGYHLLSSLVVFAEDGDILSVTAADEDGFAAVGRFAPALAGTPVGDNIVVKALGAARVLAERRGTAIGPVAILLDKRLPVASGIGGGSADAAALLRIVARALPEIAPDLRKLALELGADVPMCMEGVPALAEGVGEIVMPLAQFPSIPCVLVNPGCSVSTPEVFRRLRRLANPAMEPMPAGGFRDVSALLAHLGGSRNDLADAAEEIAPEIGLARDALCKAGASFARMSGSGGTVFGLFATADEATAAARAIALKHAPWWILETRLAPCGHGLEGR